MSQKKFYVISMLLIASLAPAREGDLFEMSSQHYGVAHSAVVNAGGRGESSQFILENQFGAMNVGRMESESFTIGTFVEISNYGDNGAMPQGFMLAQNYPNPFNRGTIFRYGLPHDAEITIAVYSVLGRRIVTLYQGFQKAGVYELHYHGVDALTAPLASGVYFCRMSTKGFDKTIKFAILR